jgi:hypothetical protein
VVVVRSSDRCPKLIDLHRLALQLASSTGGGRLPSEFLVESEGPSEPKKGAPSSSSAAAPCSDSQNFSSGPIQKQELRGRSAMLLKVATVDDEGNTHVLTIEPERKVKPVRKHRPRQSH